MNQIITLLLSLACIANIQAQSFSSPVEYIEHFNKEFVTIQELQVEYSAFLVHTRSEVAEEKRQSLLKATQASHDRLAQTQAYADDKGMKANAVKVLDIMLAIGNKSYSTIASEKVGCVDCFACILTEDELTNEDTKEMGKVMKNLVKSYEEFAKANKVELTDKDAAHETLLAKINRINDYVRQLDLSVLEAQYAGTDIVNALNAKDIAKAKENIKTLVKAAANANKRLQKIERISEDATAFGHAESLIEFYKEAAKNIYPDMVDAFDKKGEIINEKVDSYNKNIVKINNGATNGYAKYLTAKVNLQQRNIPKPKEEKVERL